MPIAPTYSIARCPSSGRNDAPRWGFQSLRPGEALSLSRIVAILALFIYTGNCWADELNRSGGSEITFLAEQSGKFETEVKQAIVPILRRSGEVRAAYLIAIRQDDESRVGLCLDATRPSDRLVADIQKAFAKIAGRNISMDIVFLSRGQVLKAAAVAKPFYLGP